MAKKKEEIAVKEEAGLPSTIDFGADAGSGFEDADSKDFAIPILSVIQSGSPQVKKSKPEYNEHAKEGMLVNSVTQELFDGDEGIEVIPCYFIRTFNEWIPRDSKEGGGLVKVWSAVDGECLLEECQMNDKGKMIMPNGHILEDTRNHYVLVINPRTGQADPCFFPLSSTQIKKSKRWNSLANGFKLLDGRIKPMFSQVYKLTTVPESNDKGDWSGIKIEHVRELTDVQQYHAARSFLELVKSGTAKIAEVNVEGDGETAY